MKETLISTDYIYKGKIVTLRKDTVRLTNGRDAFREVVEHDPAVVVLPFQAPSTVFLIRQYRRAVDKILLETTAGIIHPNEDPLEGAKRELAEETGIIANTWTKVGNAYPTPGFCTEFMHFFIAEDLSFGATNFDEDEYIEVVPYQLKDLEELITRQEIMDAKTIMSYLFLKLHLAR